MDELDNIISQLEDHKKAVDRALTALRGIEGNTIAAEPKTTVAGRPRRKFSATTRRKMALSQRRRYAALRGENVAATTAPKPEKRGKRKLSAEGLANIRAAVKKRWAMAKKQAASKEG